MHLYISPLVTPQPDLRGSSFGTKKYACLYLKATDRMKCTIELSPHVVSRSGRRFLRLVRHGISRFRKRTHSNRSAFPTVTTCVYVPSPPPLCPSILVQPSSFIAFSTRKRFFPIRSFILIHLSFSFLLSFPDSSSFPRVLVTTGSSIRNESVSRGWCIREQGVSGRNKGKFYRALGWWNERISVFLYKRIDYAQLLAKLEELRIPFDRSVSVPLLLSFSPNIF